MQENIFQAYQIHWMVLHIWCIHVGPIWANAQGLKEWNYRGRFSRPWSCWTNTASKDAPCKCWYLMAGSTNLSNLYSIQDKTVTFAVFSVLEAAQESDYSYARALERRVGRVSVGTESSLFRLISTRAISLKSHCKWNESSSLITGSIVIQSLLLFSINMSVLHEEISLVKTRSENR